MLIVIDSIAEKFVFNQPRTFSFVEDHPTPMRHGIFQPLISVMLRNNPIDLWLSFPQQHSRARFVDDFIKAWTKVMNAGRFDLT